MKPIIFNASHIKIAIVDNESSYRETLKGILSRNHRIKLYREYSTGSEFLNDIRSPYKPDICLIEKYLPDISGIECCRKALMINPNIRLVIMTALPDLESLIQSQKLDIDYLQKHESIEYFLDKIIISLLE